MLGAADGDGYYEGWNSHGERRNGRIRKSILVLIVAFCLSLAWLSYALGRYAFSVSQPSTAFKDALEELREYPNGPPTAGLKPPQVPALEVEEYEPGPRPDFQVLPPTTPLPFAFPPISDRRRVERVEAYEPFFADEQALEDWIAHGKVRPGFVISPSHPSRRHDVVVASVNGTDWEHARALEMYAQPNVGAVNEFWRVAPEAPNTLGPEAIDAAQASANIPAGAHASTASFQPGATPSQVPARLAPRARPLKKPKIDYNPRPDVSENRFREIDELRYVVRSAHSHLKDMSTLHVLSPSFRPPRPFDMQSPEKAPVGTAPVDWEAPNKKHSVFIGEDGRLQWGQVPVWLNMSRAGVLVGNGAKLHDEHLAGLRVHHDWSIYTPNWLLNHSTAGSSDQGYTLNTLVEWKQQVLPTFNSVAMESMLGNEGMAGLGDMFVYANDDMFFASDLSVSDFATPLHGPVVRFDHSLVVRARRVPDRYAKGEWPSLQHSAWLLDRRFGERVRAYVTHEPRAFSASLLREMRMTWAQEFRETAEERFRMQDPFRPGLSTHFLFAHWVIERFREAMLWSFLVLKMDEDGDGLIDVNEFTANLLQPLGIQRGIGSFSDLTSADLSLTVNVAFPYRASLDDDEHLKQLDRASFPRPVKTEYSFTSSDGYPFMTLHPFVQAKAPGRPAGGGRASGISQVGKETWPRYHPRPGLTRYTDKRYRPDRSACRLDLPACMGGLATDAQGRIKAEDLFTSWAFDKAEKCGDCLIVHLVGASGEAGLSSVLPPRGKHFSSAAGTSAETTPQEPHLPLTPHWDVSKPPSTQQTKYENPGAPLPLDSPFAEDKPVFSANTISSNLGWSGESQRAFALRLLARYQFAIGEAPGEFFRMENTRSAKGFFEGLVAERGKHAFVCLNDDYAPAAARGIKKLFQTWAKGAFPERSPWEEREPGAESVAREEATQAS